MTKDEARKEVIRRWRMLPVMERHTFEQASDFVATIEAAIDFRTMGNRQSIILAWLIKDVESLAKASTLPLPTKGVTVRAVS